MLDTGIEAEICPFLWDITIFITNRCYLFKSSQSQSAPVVAKKHGIRFWFNKSYAWSVYTVVDLIFWVHNTSISLKVIPTECIYFFHFYQLIYLTETTNVPICPMSHVHNSSLQIPESKKNDSCQSFKLNFFPYSVSSKFTSFTSLYSDFTSEGLKSVHWMRRVLEYSHKG